MSGTYQYTPIGGTTGPVTPINGNTLIGGAGSYAITGSDITFISTTWDSVSFVGPNSDGNTADMPYGGAVSFDGSGNTVNAGGSSTADARLVLSDQNAPASAHNDIVVGTGIRIINYRLQPTDSVTLQDVTPADLRAAFSAAASSGTGAPDYVSVPRAGAGPLALSALNGGSNVSMMGQFHAAG